MNVRMEAAFLDENGKLVPRSNLDPNVRRDLIIVIYDPPMVIIIREFAKLRSGEEVIRTCDGDLMRLKWSYEAPPNKEEDVNVNLGEKRKQAKTAKQKEREKWNVWTTSFMSIPPTYRKDKGKKTKHREFCESCGPHWCFLHPCGILSWVLRPIVRLITRFGFLCGLIIACRNMKEDPDESEEEEEQPAKKIQSKKMKTKVEMEEGKEGDWKEKSCSPCGLVTISAATQHKLYYEGDEDSSEGEESDEEKEENGKQAEKQHKVGMKVSWSPAKQPKKTEEEPEQEEVTRWLCCVPRLRCPSLHPLALVGWLIRPLWKLMKNNPCSFQCITSCGGEEEDDSDQSEKTERERRLREYRERVEQRREAGMGAEGERTLAHSNANA